MPQTQTPPVSINRFFTGLVSQRSPLNTPFTYAGLNIISRNDALFGGLNVEVSNNNTLVRRPGFPRYCSVGFASNEVALFYCSARINGQIVNLVDTNLAVYIFTPSTKTLLFTKSAGAGQTFFQQVGNVIYFSNRVDNKKWAPPATSWVASTVFALGTLIIDTNGNVQQVTTAGTSGGSQPTWNTTPITGTTVDGGVTWTNRGNQVSNWGIAAPVAAPTLTNSTAGAAGTSFWSPNTAYVGHVFIQDTNGNIQLAGFSGGTSGATIPVWNSVLASRTNDNTIGWFNCGPLNNWIPSTAYVIPALGSGPLILDSNGNLQQLTTAGTTGTTQPTWATTVGTTTTDNTAVWTCRSTSGAGKLQVQSGYQWVAAYHTCYGHVGTASDFTQNTGPVFASSLSFGIGGVGSADPQCDFIWIFRIRDGGGFFEFAGQVPNPGNTTWAFTDTTPDALLVEQLIAPLAHLNDPPPKGMTALSFHMKRMFGAIGNTMQFGVGPDGVIGVKEESWPPANLETFATNLQNFASTSQGLCIFTNDQWWVYQGGPQTLSFYPVKILDNFGISSPNCVAQDGDQIFLYTSGRQFWSLTPSSGKEEDGWNVGDILASTFNPASSYVAVHRNGTDVGVFLSDGSADVLRYSLSLGCWGTVYQPVGGVGAIGSIETAFGTYSLMAGRATGSGFIMTRSLTSFFDDVLSTGLYTWSAIIGSIHLSGAASPAAECDAIVLDTTNAGSNPSIGVLLNEISGLFSDVPLNGDDPYDITRSSMRSKRYDLQDISPALPNEIRHMLIQISGVAENAKNEILGFHLCPQVAD